MEKKLTISGYQVRKLRPDEWESLHQSEGVVFPQDNTGECSVNIFSDTWYGLEILGVLELARFPPGEVVLIDTLDVTKPRQFSYTNRGVVERLRDKQYVQEALNKAMGRDLQIASYLQQVLDRGSLSPVQRESFEDGFIYHGGGLIYQNERSIIRSRGVDRVARMRKRGVCGSSRGVTYFSKDFFRAINHSPRQIDAEILLLKISVDELLSKRNVFIDPESLIMRREFMRNFVVHRGIPVSAVSSAFLMRSKGETSSPELENYMSTT